MEFSSLTINYGTSTKEIVFSRALVCLFVNKQNYAKTTQPNSHTSSMETWTMVKEKNDQILVLMQIVLH